MMYPEGQSRHESQVPKASWLEIALIIALPGWAADSPQPLDIQPGLWEIALTVKTSGMPPMPPAVSEKLTAEQRARIEAKAKERAADCPRTTVGKSCLLEKDLDRPSLLAFGGDRQNCRQTIANSSPTRQEIHVDCGKDATQGGGTVLIEVIDPKSVRVSSQWSATDGSRTMKMNSTAKLKMAGRHLRRFCGTCATTKDRTTQSGRSQTSRA